MSRNPIAIALVVVSAILIVVGRVNRESPWGIWVLVVGFALLLIAAILALRTRR